MQRDDLVRHLWLTGFEFSAEHPSATRFERPGDGAVVFVPHAETVSDTLGETRTPHMSPCCGAESNLRRIFRATLIFRCSVCDQFWEREAGATRPVKLRAV